MEKSSQDKACCICNKPIYIPSISKYAYKIKLKSLFACSYTCYNKMLEQRTSQKKKYRS